MKLHSFCLLAAGFGLTLATTHAGTVVVDPVTPVPMTGGFDLARRPISNPTLFDTPLPTTNVHPIILYQRLPDYVNTMLGPLAMGGDFQVYALQFEIAVGERLSIVATKDGYVDFNPDNRLLWNDTSGWANIAAGVKYAFVLDQESSTAVSGTATFEFPTGNHKVFQGEGNGALNLIVSALKLWDRSQLAGGIGANIPFTSQLSTSGFLSGHYSYEVAPWFIPLVEVNWFHVFDTGNGRPNYFDQAYGLTPAVATFEGNDLLNFGAANASRNRDMVTAAIGFRSRIGESGQLGFAYELPLTDKRDGIMRDRFTLDFLWAF